MNMKNKAIQTEIDASYLYQKLAENEKDEVIANVYSQMSGIERGHAEAFARNANISLENLMIPSGRAKTLNLIGRIFGYDYVLGILMNTEKSLSNGILLAKKQHGIPVTGRETNHVTILRGILDREVNMGSEHITKFEKQHRSV